MTKIEARFELERPLNDSDAQGVNKAHSVYGIMRLSIAPTLDLITVDYDATRMSEVEVEAALIRNGVPVKRQPVLTAVK